MYERIKRLYNTGKLSIDGVRNAVTKGWITEAECAEILGGNSNESVQSE